MNPISSKLGTPLLEFEKSSSALLSGPDSFSEYMVLLIKGGSGALKVDASHFEFSGSTLLFSTPMQTLRLESRDDLDYHLLKFHSDFYCIETHREEVACNGLLFNNIYVSPKISLTAVEMTLFEQLFDQLESELKQQTTEMVLRSYLQLILAKSSSIKIKNLEEEIIYRPLDEKMERFRVLLDQHFLELHQPKDFAGLLHISVNLLSKKSIKYFGKTPSQLIQDRLILEAKKKLHLTTTSIKEIAFQMKFSDAYYFSRFFKKHCGISPQEFRKRGGISEVAYLSK